MYLHTYTYAHIYLKLLALYKSLGLSHFTWKAYHMFALFAFNPWGMYYERIYNIQSYNSTQQFAVWLYVAANAYLRYNLHYPQQKPYTFHIAIRYSTLSTRPNEYIQFHKTQKRSKDIGSEIQLPPYTLKLKIQFLTDTRKTKAVCVVTIPI